MSAPASGAAASASPHARRPATSQTGSRARTRPVRTPSTPARLLLGLLTLLLAGTLCPPPALAGDAAPSPPASEAPSPLARSADARTAPASNVVALTVRTPRRGFNRMVVSLTVCAPGTQRCATIDDVMIDTGATGLRLEAGAVPDWLRLPAHRGPDGAPRAGCVHFVHDDAWGPLHRADLHIGGLTARDLLVQVLDDDDPRRPSSCRLSPLAPTSNGTLGLGPFDADCRGACEQRPERPRLFACAAATPGEACRPLPGPVPLSDRLRNPATLFAGYDNGVVIDLPAVPAAGAMAVTGTLTFGVGTAANNGLGDAALLPLDTGGRFTTTYAGRAYPDSYMDSGTATYVVPADEGSGDTPNALSGGLARCLEPTWALCAAPPRERGAVMVGRDGASVATAFRVGSYAAFLASGAGASDSVAVTGAAGSRAFVWGAPFFLGRRVAVVLEGREVPGRPDARGPLHAIGAHGTR